MVTNNNENAFRTLPKLTMYGHIGELWLCMNDVFDKNKLVLTEMLYK